jgi:hypothetical protein
MIKWSNQTTTGECEDTCQMICLVQIANKMGLQKNSQLAACYSLRADITEKNTSSSSSIVACAYPLTSNHV